MKHFFQPGISLALLLSAAAVTQATAQTTIAAIAPVPNRPNAPRTSTITATFSQPLSAGSVTALKVFSTQRGGLRSANSGTTSVNGNQLSFAPNYDFQPGETVRATLTRNAQSSSGQALATPRTFEFTTAAGGSGLGSFASTTSFTAGAYPVNIHLADVDGDADLDMVSSNISQYGGTPISIRLNNGAGQFSGGSEVPLVTGKPDAPALALGDIDGDGDIDLATTNNVNVVTIRLNNGTGLYTAGGDIQINSEGITDIALADFDGDGDLDLLSYAYSTGQVSRILSLRLNNGAGQFSGGYDAVYNENSYSKSTILKAADLDGDGDLDLVRANTNLQLLTMLNDGAGNFTASTSIFAIVAALDLKDIDTDGDLDLVLLDGNGGTRVQIYLNNGAATFTLGRILGPLPGNGSCLALADVDADGDLDILAQNYVNVRIYFNNGQGAFPTYSELSGNQMDRFAVGDIDGDHDLDIVAAFYPTSPPIPPCPVLTYLNQPVAPVVLGTASSLSTQIALSPNPAQQHCTLTLPALTQATTVTISSTLGQIVKTVHLPQAATGRSIPINLSGLSPGLYVLHVKTGQDTVVKRLIKE